MSVLCASQLTLGTAAAKIILQHAHQALKTATGHIHEQVVILESSFSVKNWFLSKSGLLLASNFFFLETGVVYKKSSCVDLGKIQ